MIHAAHAHIFHGERGTWAKWRNGRSHTKGRRECGARHTGTLDRFCYESESFVLGRLDNDVIGLGSADMELVHGHRSDIQSVGADDGPWQAVKENDES